LGRACGEEHLPGSKTRVFGQEAAESGVADVIDVSDDEVVEFQSQVFESEIGVRTFGEVALDGVVTELLGRFDFDGHAGVFHGLTILRKREGSQSAVNEFS